MALIIKAYGLQPGDSFELNGNKRTVVRQTALGADCGFGIVIPKNVTVTVTGSTFPSRDKEIKNTVIGHQ